MIERGENWRLATSALKELLQDGVCPIATFYDIGCQYGKYFRRWLQSQAELHPDVVRVADQMLFPLPPFHVSMHQAACRMEHGLQNARFPGYIHPNGEPSEQFWATLGACARLKYMTLHHQKLYLESAAAYFNDRHDRSAAQGLLQRATKVQRLLASTKDQLKLLPAGQQTSEQVRSYPSTTLLAYSECHAGRARVRLDENLDPLDYGIVEYACLFRRTTAFLWDLASVVTLAKCRSALKSNVCPG
jgi:hypothetical protein